MPNKKQKTSKGIKIKNFLLLIPTILIVFGLSIALQSIIAAWTEPTATPPNNNTATPVDTSASSQTKLGDLGIGGNFAVTGNSALMGSVGVGTDTPNQKLSVTGIIQSSSGGIQFPDNTIQTSAAINKINVKVFTGSGTYTPSPGLVYAVIEVVGGGGGGGSFSDNTCSGHSNYCGGGGGGGGYARKTLTAAQIGSSQTVTIGAGGTGGVGNGSCGNNGINGGTSSFGPSGSPFLSASGGTGGYSNGNGGVGSNGNGGDLNIYGSDGFNALIQTSCQSFDGGGSSYFGPGCSAWAGNGINYGGGGCGGYFYAHNGGAGAGGVVIVTEYIKQ